MKGLANNMVIEDIYPENFQETRGVIAPAKKIDLGNCYMIYVMGVQPAKK